MTSDLQDLRRAHRRAAAAAGRVTEGLIDVGGLFDKYHDELIERYRCSVCNGRRLEGVGGTMIGPYYRVCRGCDGRGYQIVDEEEE